MIVGAKRSLTGHRSLKRVGHLRSCVLIGSAHR